MESNTFTNSLRRTIDVTRKSQVSGKVHTIAIRLNPADLERYEQGKAMIQDCFPYLTPGEREFIKTGITESEWADIFGGDDEP